MDSATIMAEENESPSIIDSSQAMMVEMEDIKPDINIDEEAEDEKPDIENLDKSNEELADKPEKKIMGVRFSCQDGTELTFKVPNTIKMEKIMNSISERLRTPAGDLRFHYNGVRVRKEDTPEKLQMEDDDEITVNEETRGGGK